MRGRNNNGGNNNNGNRKSPNPLQRSYESNGPDVKVRGTAQHVAEKYLQLARDAQSSGDTVAAEAYFQHAEHYYRILLAAQEQMTQQFGHTFPPNRAFVDVEDEVEEEGDEDGQGGFAPGAGQQPDFRGQNGHLNGNGYNGHGGQRSEGAQGGEGFEGQQQGGQRFDRQNRRERFNNDRRFDRNQPQDRNQQDRNQQDRGERRFDRNGEQGQGGYAPRPDAPRSDIPVGGNEPAMQAEAAPQQPQSFEPRAERAPRPERRPRRERQPEPEADDVASALPSFLTNPVRTVAAEPVSAASEAPVAAPVETGDDAPAEAPPKRTRRRRSPREVMDALGSETDGAAE